MADNYLERRMEDLRSGKLTVKSAIPGIRPRSQRVLIASEISEEVLCKLLEYRKKGCRVALFDSDEKTGRQMAYKHGIRFHPVNIKKDADFKKELFSLLDVWRGIDVILADEDKSKLIKQTIEEWKTSLPIPK